ncbi:ensconsin isoform X3 [Syngnathus acus]|uniref:ensconsin isoform X3 n=1 Tax=Syngnathus acus TaxID=161584 RepID=UPI001885D6AF|nr:ensconsin isoform X3 [Syngnathus acus]
MRKGRRAARGEGSKPARPRKGGGRSAVPRLFTITEEDDGHKRRDGRRRKTKASFYKSDDGRMSSPAGASSSLSGRAYSPALTSTPTPTGTSGSPNNSAAGPKIDSSLFNKTDERLRLARERREEREKQNATKEAEWQAREERARRHYEKHLEERRRKLEEQRIKEEQRRLAVEEKRRQKLEEDKVRHEAVLRRTMERGQASRPKANRWSWGGPVRPGTPTDADRRSASTVNLSKHHDSVITKRLSSSSATLLHSPDRGLRRLPLTPWESNVVNRLQQPTHSYLARSRSAMSLSGEQTAMPVCPRSVSCHPTGSASFKTLPGRPLSHSRSHDRSLARETASSAPARRRTTGTPQTPQKNRDSVRKSWSNLSLPLGPSLTLPLKLRSSSPIKRNTKVTAPSPGRPSQNIIGRPPTPKMLKSPVAEDPGNLRPLKVLPEIPQPSNPVQSQEAEDEQVLSPPRPAEHNKAATGEPSPKPSAGTTDREEASRILAENRRLVREQREREEEERKQQEEQARLAQEEMARRKAEERAKREEEAQRQAEERKLKEEEERGLKEEEERRMEEERLRQEREEAERAQKQREEEESRQKEETDRLRQEREKHFQKEEAERLERKKRLEEIMKRTRRSDASDKKATPSKNTDDPAAVASPGPSQGSPASSPHSNGCQADPNLNTSSTSTHSAPMQRENGEFDEGLLEPPAHSRLKGDDDDDEEQKMDEDDERVAVVAFKENGLSKPHSAALPDDITAQQGAGRDRMTSTRPRTSRKEGAWMNARNATTALPGGTDACFLQDGNSKDHPYKSHEGMLSWRQTVFATFFFFFFRGGGGGSTTKGVYTIIEIY